MIVLATTLHAYVTDRVETSQSWLLHAEAIRASHPDGVRLFAALEVDARGLAPFQPLLDLMGKIDPGCEFWTFSFDDGADKITTANRLRRITTGQNFANIYADTVGATHMLFCAADCAPPPDVLPKLLEMHHPLVGPEIPTYCLSGPTPVEPDSDGIERDVFDFPVQEHMASAACILLAREVFTKLRWRTDGDTGMMADPDEIMTDDPCLHHDALHLLGIPTYVRKDIVAKHYPESIPAIEYRGHDMKVYR